ncbi:endospore germination permease [Ammoniphilus sp. YIM 78166]|uniref:GerAB/ArcD/ProY family transporter n=1 Tax=Ammoniphilus sp. YIM 78166 TaxID=1644106 RepID=UPI0014312E2C|nr:endospore germination permease [Ammoniphilus sp. YIM 78166]
MEKGRITPIQMALLLYTNSIATAILSAPGIMYKFAERDLWLSVIWGSLAGFLTIYLAWKLHLIHPNKTLTQYMNLIVGKTLGKILGFVYSSYYLIITGIALRQYSEMVVGAFLNRTPIYILMGSIMLACSLAVRGGLEVIARLSDMLVPILILMWVIVVVLLIPEMNIQNILPVMENGIMPSLKGALIAQQFFALFFFLPFILPFLSDQKRSLQWGFYSVLAVMVTLTVTSLATLFLFGNITGSFLYPVMSAVRYIQYADFFENLESVVMAIWIGGSFIKLGLMLYVVAMSTAQWLDFPDYKTLSLPMAFLITMMAIWVFPNVSEMSQFLTRTFFMMITFFILIPATLLLIAQLRQLVWDQGKGGG